MPMIGTPNAANDLGFGSMLRTQVADETDEERKKREMGLAPQSKNSLAAQQLFGFGATGVGQAFGSASSMGLGLNAGRF